MAAFRIRGEALTLQSADESQIVWFGTGQGAPSGGSMLEGAACGVYIRENASTEDTVCYVTRDSGSTWKALEAGGDAATVSTLTVTTLDLDKALTGTGDAANVAVTTNHATQTTEAIDLTASAVTTARTGGEIVGVKVSLVGLAGDNGGEYVILDANATDNGGTSTMSVIKVGAGFDVLIDVSEAASGEADIVVNDNVASALQIREATNAYLTVVTTNGSEALQADETVVATDGVRLNDSSPLRFGTPGTDLVLTPDGADVVATATGDLVIGDDVDLMIGTTKDHAIRYVSGSARTDFVGLNLTDGSTGDLRIDTGDATSATGAKTSGLIAVESGMSTTAGNNGGNTGAISIVSGAARVATAHIGGASGAVSLSSGATDSTDGGGTGGSSGTATISTGNASSTAGSSGNSGNVNITTGNSEDSNSGDIVLTNGTAGGTPGFVKIRDAADNTKIAMFDNRQIPTGTTRSVRTDLLPLARKTTIATAAVKTLNAAAVEVVPAPGAGLFIEVISIHAWLDFGTVGYDAVAGGDDLEFRYTGAGGDKVTADIAGSGFGDAVADEHRITPGIAVEPVANAGIYAHIAGSEWFGAAGNSPLVIETLYRVRTLEP